MTDVTMIVPNDERLQELQDLFKESDFKFPTVKISENAKKQQFEVQKKMGDPDSTEDIETFDAVVLFAKPNFYLSDEAKAAGEAPKEKRELYLLRSTKTYPERMYISPTSLYPWKRAVKEAGENDCDYFGVIMHFEAEKAESKDGRYKWNKVKLNVVRPLTEDEFAAVEVLHDALEARSDRFAAGADLDDYESAALSGKRKDFEASKNAPKAAPEKPLTSTAPAVLAEADADVDDPFDEEKQLPAPKGKKADPKGSEDTLPPRKGSAASKFSDE